MQRWPTYALVFLVSGGAFLTQTLVSGYWTSAFSDDIFNYSFHLAFFFLSLGLGAIFSSQIKNPKRDHAYALAFASAFVLGGVIPFLKTAIVSVGGHLAIPLFCVVVEGTLAGALIPLLLRLKNKELSLGKLFFIDYISALVLSSIFTFFLLIPFGFSKTGFFAGSTVAVLVSICWLVEKGKFEKKILWVLPGIGLLFWALTASTALVSIKKEKDRSSKVILSRQSHYQKIVLMEEIPNEPALQGENQFVLYLDGFLQFATIDEQTYHACIANVPLMAYFNQGISPKNVLILGGGDGLAARNVLMNQLIERVTLVELDPTMIEIARNHPIFRKHNLDALRSSRIEIINADAFHWVHSTPRKFDVVIIDFPLPKNLTLARLYSAEFYKDIFKLLTDQGIVAIQSGPSFSYEDPQFETLSKVTASILKTIESVGQKGWAYTSVLDNEAFVIASPSKEFDFEKFAILNTMHEEKGFGRLCAYRSQWKRPTVEVNTLNTLPIAGYMLDWIRAGRSAFFHYRGTSANFLPE